jgi:hypothetical protein
MGLFCCTAQTHLLSIPATDIINIQIWPTLSGLLTPTQTLTQPILASFPPPNFSYTLSHLLHMQVCYLPIPKVDPWLHPPS